MIALRSLLAALRLKLGGKLFTSTTHVEACAGHVRPVVRTLLERHRIFLPDSDSPPALKVFSGIAYPRSSGGPAPGPRSVPLDDRSTILWMRIDSPTGAIRRDLDLTLDRRLDKLRAEHNALLLSGRARLILDWSHEGRRLTKPILSISEILRSRGIHPSQCILLTQNQSLHRHYAAARSVPTDRIHIVPAHHHLACLWQMISLQSDDPTRTFDQPVGFAATSGQRRRYRYICLNYHLRPARAMVVSRLLERPEKGWISFDVNRTRQPGASNLARFWRNVKTLSLPEESTDNETLVRSIIDEGLHIPSDASTFDEPARGVYHMPVEAFQDSELYIVTESEMAPPGLRRFTEKTLKAIIAGIPFIVFGNRGTVASLSEIGFDTLNDFIDHEYDCIDDPARRFAAAWAEVERFLKRPAGFTKREVKRLRAAAEHNQSVFSFRLPEIWIIRPLTEIDRLSGSGSPTLAR